MCSRNQADPTALERQALALDEALVGAARALGAFELAVGVVLARLFDRRLVCELGYSRESDYIRERLEISPSLALSWARLARELRHRPILRQAVTAGLVSTRKALAVLPLAVGDFEGPWTEAAMRIGLREIESAVKAAGKESPEERFEADVLVLPMTPEQQDRLDAALAHAKWGIGPEAKRWQCMEAISLEYLSDFAEYDGGGVRGPEGPPPVTPHAARLVTRFFAAVEEALEVMRKILDEHPDDDALSLDACARRLLSARRSHDEAFGILAEQARFERIHVSLRYGSFDAYCTERLGMRAETVRQRIWLEGRMRDLPKLREAVSSGRLGFTKAVIVARHATPFDVDDWIGRARSTTVQQLEREAQALEDRKNRGKCVRKLWSPEDAAETVRAAIAAAQAKALAEEGVAIDAGEALAVVADHIVKVAEDHMAPNDPRRFIPSIFRRTALVRTGGLCAVPGCSRAAVHVHHIVFRSRGGKDTPENGVALCAVHHLHGVHLGYLEVTGRAGERLHWKFATGEAVPTEEWTTYGDDDVRRSDFAAPEVVAEGSDAGWIVRCRDGPSYSTGRRRAS